VDAGNRLARDFRIRPSTQQRQSNFDVVGKTNHTLDTPRVRLRLRLFPKAAHESRESHDAVAHRHSDIARCCFRVGIELLQDVAPDVIVGAHADFVSAQKFT
jgi:hypothetical protein